MKLKIEKIKDYWVVNNKYNITKDGVVWYDNDYIGTRKDFPQYLFEIAKIIKSKKRI